MPPINPPHYTLHLPILIPLRIPPHNLPLINRQPLQIQKLLLEHREEIHNRPRRLAAQMFLSRTAQLLGLAPDTLLPRLLAYAILAVWPVHYAVLRVDDGECGVSATEHHADHVLCGGVGVVPLGHDLEAGANPILDLILPVAELS